LLLFSPFYLSLFPSSPMDDSSLPPLSIVQLGFTLRCSFPRIFSFSHSPVRNTPPFPPPLPDSWMQQLFSFDHCCVFNPRLLPPPSLFSFPGLCPHSFFSVIFFFFLPTFLQCSFFGTVFCCYRGPPSSGPLVIRGRLPPATFTPPPLVPSLPRPALCNLAVPSDFDAVI